MWVPALSDNIVNLPPREPRASVSSIPTSNNYNAERYRSVSPTNEKERDIPPTIIHPEPKTPVRDEETISRHMRSLSVYPDARRHSEDNRAIASASRVGEGGRSSRVDFYTRQNDFTQPIPAISFNDTDRRSQSNGNIRADVDYGKSVVNTRGPSPSRSATIPHPPTSGGSRYESEPQRYDWADRTVSRSQTLPSMTGNDLAHPRPQPPSVSAGRAELRPTFSPSIVRTPADYDQRHNSPIVLHPDNHHATQSRSERYRDSQSKENRYEGISEPITRRTVQGYEHLRHTPDSNATPRVIPPSYLPESNSSYSGVPRSASLPASMFSTNSATQNLQLISEEPGELLSPLIVEDPLPDPAETVHNNSLSRQATLPFIEDESGTNYRRAQSMPLTLPSRSPRQFDDRSASQRHDSAPIDSRRPSPRTPTAYPIYPRSSPREYDSSSSSSTVSPVSKVRQSPNPSPKVQAVVGASLSSLDKGKSPVRSPYRDEHLSVSPQVTHSPSRHHQDEQTSPSLYTPTRAQSRHDGEHNISPHTPTHVSSPPSHSTKYTPTRLREHDGGPYMANSYHTIHSESSSPNTLTFTSSSSSPSSRSTTSPHTPTHISSPSHNPSSSSARTPTRPQFRHVRAGYWNRRGDHLTQDGYIVYCPSPRIYPKDLTEYPEEGFMDHHGNKVVRPPGQEPRELPASIAHDGHSPKQPYDTVCVV